MILGNPQDSGPPRADLTFTEVLRSLPSAWIMFCTLPFHSCLYKSPQLVRLSLHAKEEVGELAWMIVPATCSCLGVAKPWSSPGQAQHLGWIRTAVWLHGSKSCPGPHPTAPRHRNGGRENSGCPVTTSFPQCAPRRLLTSHYSHPVDWLI